jgi:hypothetical protein
LQKAKINQKNNENIAWLKTNVAFRVLLTFALSLAITSSFAFWKFWKNATKITQFASLIF